MRGTEGGESGEEIWQVWQGLVGHREDLGFYPKGGGKPRELWAGEGWDLLRCSQAPSGGCCSEDRLRGWGGSLVTRAGATPCSREAACAHLSMDLLPVGVSA